MNHIELRKNFLNYFEQAGHKIVASSSLIPTDDPTLMFTNAGMNQFKDVLLGNEVRSYKRAASVQKCLRVAGKHNDFEVVGYDGYHHTFFEMLGNWSFGDYYKKEAIEFAWEYLTRILKIPENKLIVSVYKDDDESFDIWNKIIKIPASKILRLGDISKGDEENFWSMGETGPCGFCSELHYDLGENFEKNLSDSIVGYDKRYIEIWNLVFMEFYRDANGNFTPLKMKSVDTGMGFERLYAILQEKYSNYHTDLFMPVIKAIEEISSRNYKEDAVSFQVIADHIRALSFAIADGGIFSNEGRGYILRKILRRAVRYFKKLGVSEPAIFKLVKPLVQVMGDFYNELKERQNIIEKLIKMEEEKFLSTLENGLKIFNEIIEKKETTKANKISGKDVFLLYDTYGFPIETIREMAKEKKLEIDEVGFNKFMEEQREKGRKSFKASSQIINEEKILKLLENMPETISKCYETTETVSRIVAIIKENELVGELQAPANAGILLDITPFYAESGGQIADKGIIFNPDFKFNVEDVQKYGNRYIIHWGTLEYGIIKKDLKVEAEVNKELRKATERNHTATHLLQAALRKILGTHITQAGSYVGPDRLRFDFTHYQALTDEELEKVELLVNQKITENLKVEKFIEEKEKAIKMGAMAIFGEKYGEKVRVVKSGNFSIELCGGTHLDYTGEIGLFIITSESAIASGIRRIEALTGMNALKYVLNQRKNIEQLKELLKVSDENITEKVKRLIEDNKNLEKKIKELKFSSGKDIIAELLKDKITKNNSYLVIAKFENEDMKYLNSIADRLKNEIKSGIILLVNQVSDKANLILVLTDDMVKKGIDAKEVINSLSKIIGGSGGGRKDRASAGGKMIEKIPELIETAKKELLKLLE